MIADAAGKRIVWEGDIVGSETFNTNTIEKAFFTKKPSPPELLQKAFSGAIDELSRHPDIQRALKSAMPQTIVGHVFLALPARKWAATIPQWLAGLTPTLAGCFIRALSLPGAVIVEELVHLRVPNHSTLFKSMLRAHLAQV